MVTERSVSFRPNIVIGLGGMGTSFVARIKRLVTAELDRQIEMGLISVDQKSQALAQRFHFIGIDSWNDGALPGVTPYQELDNFYALTPRGNINQVLPALFKDSGFASWFPRDYQPGAYVHGCGHVHLRGRLAYMLQKEQNAALDAGAIVRNAI